MYTYLCCVCVEEKRSVCFFGTERVQRGSGRSATEWAEQETRLQLILDLLLV